MRKAKIIIAAGIVAIVALSTWVAVGASPLNGIAVFFVLTCLLWAVARIKRWI